MGKIDKTEENETKNIVKISNNFSLLLKYTTTTLYKTIIKYKFKKTTGAIFKINKHKYTTNNIGKK